MVGMVASTGFTPEYHLLLKKARPAGRENWLWEALHKTVICRI